MVNTEPTQQQFISRTRLCSAFVAASVLLFLASLTQDGFYIDRPDDPRAWASCFVLLMAGWIVVFEGVLAWLANPVLVIAWILIWFREGRKISLIVAMLALVLSLSFLLHGDILTNEAGGRSKITGYGAGYWMWVGSGAVLVLGNVSLFFISPQRTKLPSEPAS